MEAVADLTDNPVDSGPSRIEQAQAALDRCAWAEALDLALGARVSEGRPEADRLDVVAEASWWLGSLDDCIGAREQAYARYEALGDHVSAGQCAVWLYEHHMIKTRSAIAGAWLRRARRALDTQPDCEAFGALVLREAELAHGSGDLELAMLLARTALDLGRRLPSLDLEARRCRRSVGCSSTRDSLPKGSATSTRRCCRRSKVGSTPTRRAKCTAA